MFSLGLEFKLAKLKQFLGASLIGALGVLVALVALFAFVGHLYGSSLNVSFLLGATVSLSSTTGTSVRLLVPHF
jgi:Kef-type K+ transport system membrane component KefB